MKWDYNVFVNFFSSMSFSSHKTLVPSSVGTCCICEYKWTTKSCVLVCRRCESWSTFKKNSVWEKLPPLDTKKINSVVCSQFLPDMILWTIGQDLLPTLLTCSLHFRLPLTSVSLHHFRENSMRAWTIVSFKTHIILVAREFNVSNFFSLEKMHPLFYSV